MEDVYTVSGYGSVKQTLRRWWVNCASEADDEILAIDNMEDSIVPLDASTVYIRQLIGCLECCHHKTERHVEIIIAAMGSGSTMKGQGRRDSDELSPRELEYQALLRILSSWQTGAVLHGESRIGEYSESELCELLGDPTPLKTWQVQMVMEKIGRFLDPDMRWNRAHAKVVDAEYVGEEAEFSDITKLMVIHDMKNGQPAGVTLATAIDMLTGCNWNFSQNISTILAAIGGEAHAQHPLALHDRNIRLNPARGRMQDICHTLSAFTEGQQATTAADVEIFRTLGPQTPVKRWLAASLAKTIRLQLEF